MKRKPLVGKKGREVRIAWLVKHWKEIRNYRPNAIAVLMKRDGLYAPSMTITDIRIGLSLPGPKPCLLDAARSIVLRDPKYQPADEMRREWKA